MRMSHGGQFKVLCYASRIVIYDRNISLKHASEENNNLKPASVQESESIFVPKHPKVFWSFQATGQFDNK